MIFDQKLLVLTYHRVLAAPDPLRPAQTDVSMFEKHAKSLATAFNVLDINDAADRLEQGTLPSRAVVITFDDGYADNATTALPILKENNLTATFFIATGFLDGGRMWNDTIIESIRACTRDAIDLSPLDLGHHELKTIANRREAISKVLEQLKYLEPSSRTIIAEEVECAAGVDLPNDLMMSSAQVRQLVEQGMSIGAHTVSHPILAQIGAAEAKQEIEQSRNRLEEIVDQPVRMFAYPNGRPTQDYTRTHVDMVRSAGFRVAVTTASGCVSCDCDSMQWPRVVSWDRSSLRFSLRLLQSYFKKDAPRLD